MHIYQAYIILGVLSMDVELPIPLQLTLCSLLFSYVSCMAWVFYLDNYGYYTESQRLRLRDFVDGNYALQTSSQYKFLRTDLFNGLTAGAMVGFTLFVHHCPEINNSLRTTVWISLMADIVLLYPEIQRKSRLFLHETLMSTAWVLYVHQVAPKTQLSVPLVNMANFMIASTTLLQKKYDLAQLEDEDLDLLLITRQRHNAFLNLTGFN